MGVKEGGSVCGKQREWKGRRRCEGRKGNGSEEEGVREKVGGSGERGKNGKETYDTGGRKTREKSEEDKRRSLKERKGEVKKSFRSLHPAPSSGGR